MKERNSKWDMLALESLAQRKFYLIFTTAKKENTQATELK